MPNTTPNDFDREGTARGSMAPFFAASAATIAASTEAFLRARTHTLSMEASESILRRWQRRIWRAGDHVVTVAGRENVEVGRAYVVMSNRRSLLDIPAILASMPGPVRMLGRVEMASMPFVGPLLQKMGFVFPRHGERRCTDLERRLHEGISVWVTGEAKSYASAMNTGAPILPVWIEGTERIVERGTLRSRPKQHVDIRVGAAVDSDVDDERVLEERVNTALLALSLLPPAPSSPWEALENDVYDEHYASA